MTNSSVCAIKHCKNHADGTNLLSGTGIICDAHRREWEHNELFTMADSGQVQSEAKCHRCGGSGTQEWPPDYRGETTVTCPTCSGTGTAKASEAKYNNDSANYSLGAESKIASEAKTDEQIDAELADIQKNYPKGWTWDSDEREWVAPGTAKATSEEAAKADTQQANDTTTEPVAEGAILAAMGIYPATGNDMEHVAAIQALIDSAVNKARHDQRHEDIGVSKWIKVGEEWGHWQHPMTARKCRDTLAFPEATRRAE